MKVNWKIMIFKFNKNYIVILQNSNYLKEKQTKETSN